MRFEPPDALVAGVDGLAVQVEVREPPIGQIQQSVQHREQPLRGHPVVVEIAAAEVALQ